MTVASNITGSFEARLVAGGCRAFDVARRGVDAAKLIMPERAIIPRG